MILYFLFFGAGELVEEATIRMEVTYRMQVLGNDSVLFGIDLAMT
jgi:hypothetical protein